MDKKQILLKWFTMTPFDWEEYLLGAGKIFKRQTLPDYEDIHFIVDQPASKLFHAAFSAALHCRINLGMNKLYPVSFCGRKLVATEDGKLLPSDGQYVTSPVRCLTFESEGPVITTESGSRYLLVGEDLAFRAYKYLQDQLLRPDLIDKIFSIV